MKLKALSIIFTIAVLLFSLSACSTDLPRVRASNQRAEVVDVQLKPLSGSTININDVGPGSATGYIEAPTDQYEIDANVENVSPSATTHFRADEDETYTIVVINSHPPTLRVDKPQLISG